MGLVKIMGVGLNLTQAIVAHAVRTHIRLGALRGREHEADEPVLPKPQRKRMSRSRMSVPITRTCLYHYNPDRNQIGKRDCCGRLWRTDRGREGFDCKCYPLDT